MLIARQPSLPKQQFAIDADDNCLAENVFIRTHPQQLIGQ